MGYDTHDGLYYSDVFARVPECQGAYPATLEESDDDVFLRNCHFILPASGLRELPTSMHLIIVNSVNMFKQKVVNINTRITHPEGHKSNQHKNCRQPKGQGEARVAVKALNFPGGQMR